MPEPCGICLPQTQSTVTRLVHQNSGFHSWELITKTRNMEIRSLKTVLGHKVLFPLGTPCRALTRVPVVLLCLWGHGVCWHLGWLPGTQARGNDSRKRAVTAGAEHVTGASGTPRSSAQPRQARTRCHYEMKCLATLWFVPLTFCHFIEPSFVFVGTPRCAARVQILVGAAGMSELPKLEAKLNCFAIQILLVFSPGMVNLFISDWKWGLQGPSVVLSQCLQVVRAQSISPKEDPVLEGGAHHLWNPCSLFPCWITRAEPFFLSMLYLGQGCKNC